MQRQDNDLELVRQSQQGSRSAFGRLVSKYYEMVYAVAYGVVNHREKAADITQEVFLKAFQMIKGFEGKSKITTWLYRITVNRAIDETRRKRPQESLEEPVDTKDSEVSKYDRLEDVQPGPRDLAAGGELRELMRNALKQLSEEHRAVLVLREWQGLSYEEIAGSLNIELGTVMSRIFYAKKRLAQVLKGTEKTML